MGVPGTRRTPRNGAGAARWRRRLVALLCGAVTALAAILPAGAAAGPPGLPAAGAAVASSCASGELPTGGGRAISPGGTASATGPTGRTGSFEGPTTALQDTGSGPAGISPKAPYDPARLAPTGPAPTSPCRNGPPAGPESRLGPLAGRDPGGRSGPATRTGAGSEPGDGGSLSARSGPGGPLAATPGAAPAVGARLANGPFGGARLAGRTAAVPATGVATVLSAATVTATRIDVGESTTFSMEGTGAAGYAYTATVVPGLAATPVAIPCPGVSIPGGLLQLACSVSLAYPNAGSAAPVAYLANGYSNASANFPAVSVAPSPMPVVTPFPIRAYVGQPVTVTATMAGGTGTPPFGPACLADGRGDLACEPPPGPSWSFPIAYPAVGSYRAEFTVLDDAGVNATEAIPVTVGDRPALGALAAASATPPPGAPDRLVADLTGGIAPFDYWFNESSPAGTLLSGVFATGGEVGGNLTLAAPGLETISLTVVDALGTHVASALLLDVSVGTALGLNWAAGGPQPALVAGEPREFSLAAVGAGGARVPDFAAWANLTVLAQPIGPFFLNGSIRGPLPRGPPATYTFRPGDWESGYLNFSLTLLRSGPYALDLTSILPVAGTDNGTFPMEVLPQLRALRLVDPMVAVPGARSNATLWHLVDPYGNPALPGSIFVVEEFGGANDTWSTAVATNATSAFAWINYSAPGSGPGLLLVVSAFGELLLGPVPIPALPPAGLLDPALLAGAAGAGAALLAVGLLRRRGRRPATAPPPLSVGELDPEELRRQAEGREALLARIRRAGPLDLEEILGATGGDLRPDRTETAEWLASLLTEGLVRAPVGADGVPRFSAAAPAAPVAGAAPALQVHLDPAARDRALRSAAEPPPAGPDGEEPPKRPPDYGGG